MQRYDVIVIGCGGVGGAAVYHLARRGVRVAGVERFAAGHDRGSSHGQSRIIRKAYFEHSDYVPLVLRAYEQWRSLEAQCGRTLMQRIGLVQVGPADGEVIRGVMESARRHRLNVEQLSMADARSRFGGFRFADDCLAVYEAEAGWLAVEACVEAHLQEAERLGAELHLQSPAARWRIDGNEVIVETGRRTLHAAKLIVAGGAWSGELLPNWRRLLTVRRKPQYWFAAESIYEAARDCPAFLYEVPEGVYYGLPAIDARGVKLARHDGGPTVADPLRLDREVDQDDRRMVQQFAGEHLPGVSGKMTAHAACMYTMTPDGHFLVGRYDEQQRVFAAAGLSGHGFKFAPVLGEALADLAIAGRTDLPIGFLSPGRFDALSG